MLEPTDDQLRADLRRARERLERIRRGEEQLDPVERRLIRAVALGLDPDEGKDDNAAPV